MITSRDFDRTFNGMFRFFWIWFAFVAVMMLAMFGGTAYVVFLLLQHFGVI